LSGLKRLTTFNGFGESRYASLIMVHTGFFAFRTSLIKTVIQLESSGTSRNQQCSRQGDMPEQELKKQNPFSI
jgi:hypothetical protein